MIQDREIKRKVHEDFEKHVMGPYMEEDATDAEKTGKKEVDVTNALSYERLWNMEYFHMLYQEVLR